MARCADGVVEQIDLALRSVNDCGRVQFVPRLLRQTGHPVGADPDHHDRHRGSLRQTPCGNSFIPKNIGRRAHGTQTVRRPFASARAVASAT